MNKAISDVTAERLRQVQDEGWDAAHDDQHLNGELARSAATYAALEHCPIDAYEIWPFMADPKDKGHRRNCVRAAALLLAEIERLDRLPQTTAATDEGVMK